MQTSAKLPPFRSLLKSTEVEDPVNLLVHRPLAYGFVRSIFRTRMTPNMVTFLAMVVGIVAGCMFLWGTRTAMIVGGALLWTSAILDGADGLLARAKNMHSDFGRALDGSADMVVAICTVFPAFAHLWITHRDPGQLWMMTLAVPLTLVHLWTYDFYKESYLRMTRLDRGGEGQDLAAVSRMLDDARRRGAITYFAVRWVLIPFLEAQHTVVKHMDSMALRERRTIARNPRSAAIYRKYNQGPMRIWAIVSLAPHSYLMAICAMADRLDVYLWIRVVAMNVVYLVGAIWQRRATTKTNEELAALGAITWSVPSVPHRDVLATDV